MLITICAVFLFASSVWVIVDKKNPMWLGWMCLAYSILMVFAGVHG